MGRVTLHNKLDWVNWFIAEFSNGRWITPTAVFISAGFSALAAWLVARQTVKEQRIIQAKKATLDLIASREVDKEFIDAKNDFNEQRDLGSFSFEFAVKPPSTKIRENVRIVLNDYELIAVGIQQGILDEEFYKKWFKGKMMRDYDAVRFFIAKVRVMSGNNEVYRTFENLAVSWGAKGVPPIDEKQ